ncbi:AP-4 complex subunit beta-1-like [Limulus polyphemus]|uniref:AP complex subunit beta n=1 Tax=Limulus polyphemus TaxID=6850 RepID=A0ABM1C535_LIMPO|nr:AP-4 complex subunit beta-1-like [Limulus polyphemus]
MAQEVKNIILTLSQLTVMQDVVTRRDVMRRVLALMNLQVDLRPVIGHLFKYLAVPDLVVKKVVYSLLVRYVSDVPELTLLASNTILKDLSDSNPLVRSLGTKSLLNIPYFQEQIPNVLLQAFQDRSPQVRRTAVVNCVQILKEPGLATLKHETLDQLYMLIRDTDPLVVVYTLAVLDRILVSEGGIVITRKMKSYLVNRLEMFHDWSILGVTRLFLKCHPESQEELLSFLNSLDEHLEHSNPAIVLGVTDFLNSLLKTSLSHLAQEVIEHVTPKLCFYLASTNHELVFASLEFIEKHLKEHLEIFSQRLSSFFCKFSDPVFVKLKKLTMLPMLATASNIRDIVDELKMYCTNHLTVISKTAINSLSQIVNFQPSMSSPIINFFLQLLELEIKPLVETVFQNLSGLEFQVDQRTEQNIVSSLFTYRHVVSSPEGKCAILNLLTMYDQANVETPYVLEELIEQCLEESTIVKHTLLVCCVKIFLNRPAELQEMLGRLFEHLLNDNSPTLIAETQFFYKLLKTGTDVAQQIVFGDLIR